MNKYLLLAATAVLAAAAPLSASYAGDYAAEAGAEVVTHTLVDGTIVHVKGENVFVVDADGVETPAPDGEHTLEDGTTVVTQGGVLVHGDDAVEDAVEETEETSDHSEHGEDHQH